MFVKSSEMLIGYNGLDFLGFQPLILFLTQSIQLSIFEFLTTGTVATAMEIDFNPLCLQPTHSTVERMVY